METNPDILLSKSRGALAKYKHQVRNTKLLIAAFILHIFEVLHFFIYLLFQVVVGNILETRKSEVMIVTSNEVMPIKLDQNEQKNGLEIERKIIEDLVQRHTSFMS